ncbi:alpha/beta hydrolase [Allonocardiopsis opalescens]|uniref:Carboxylesterase n=1 Tax=Allonocardiopsis opalescens TaxID=1144618 RepID=A0A2T0PZP1_9ACTN|nr:alpha/beta fold hydrolase [Allonocardiopsis opalescens]PRX97022.1 carboxylesterase [Allonocardiopsis opalescens]
MALLPGAEPFAHEGGPVGVLLCHGFTGTPQSLRPWAEHLAAAGLTVSLPLLPGHGTTWRDMAATGWRDWYGEAERALLALSSSCERVFVMGLSLGGCMALRLALRHGEGVRGVVLVNPSLAPDTKLFLLAPALKWLVPSLRGVTDDIKRDGVHEVGYDRVPVRAAATLPELWRLTRAGLPSLTRPVLAFHSAEDHVVGPASMAVLRAAVPPHLLTVRECPDSYHVATLDNDADDIFAASLDFVSAHARERTHE